MAEAAEETADWTLGQILATGVEAILLAIAIGVASWAGYWAKRAAIATADTVQLTRKNSQIELRAWMTYDQVHVKKFVVDKTIVRYFFTTEWKNAGSTPAISCRSWVVAQVAPQTVNTSEINFDKSQTIEVPGASVGPGSTMITQKIILDAEKILSVMRKESRLFIWNRLEYKDIFDDKKIRHIEICLEVNCTGKESAILDPDPKRREFEFEHAFFDRYNTVS